MRKTLIRSNLQRESGRFTGWKRDGIINPKRATKKHKISVTPFCFSCVCLWQTHNAGRHPRICEAKTIDHFS